MRSISPMPCAACAALKSPGNDRTVCTSGARMMVWKLDSFRIAVVSALVLAGASLARAQTADQAWLRYSSDHGRGEIPTRARALDESALERSAVAELNRGIAGFTAASSNHSIRDSAREIVVGTAQQIRNAFPDVKIPSDIGPEGYWIDWTGPEGKSQILIAGADERGALYGAFSLLRALANVGETHVAGLRSHSAMPIRWVDEWDNPDGSIERGYAGRSIFFEGGNVRDDLTPVGEYARLLASVGINGCNINNVNAAPQLLDADHLKQIARVADAMRPWGVRLAMSVDIASPQKWAVWQRMTRSIPRSRRGGRPRLRRSTHSSPTLPASRSRPIQRARRARRATAADRPMRPTCWPRRWSARRRGALSRFCLQQSPRLARPEGRPRPRRLRHLSSARRQVRRQRNGADQGGAHRLSSARAGIAALRGPAQNQAGHGAADHAGVHSASNGTSSTSRPCGSRCSTSICARTTVQRR